jgi:hypothetical protein
MGVWDQTEPKLVRQLLFKYFLGGFGLAGFFCCADGMNDSCKTNVE